MLTGLRYVAKAVLIYCLFCLYNIFPYICLKLTGIMSKIPFRTSLLYVMIMFCSMFVLFYSCNIKW